jgi:hypothetical protein
MMRAVLAALAALFAAAGVASAADPLIGGKLTAYGDHAVVVSQATMPVAVTMAGESVTATPQRFTLSPGQSVRVALSGPAEGSLSAHLSALGSPGTGDVASVTLQVTLKAPPPPEPPYGPLALVAPTRGGIDPSSPALAAVDLSTSEDWPMT